MSVAATSWLKTADVHGLLSNLRAVVCFDEHWIEGRAKIVQAQEPSTEKGTATATQPGFVFLTLILVFDHIWDDPKWLKCFHLVSRVSKWLILSSVRVGELRAKMEYLQSFLNVNGFKSISSPLLVSFGAQTEAGLFSIPPFPIPFFDGQNMLLRMLTTSSPRPNRYSQP